MILANDLFRLVHHPIGSRIWSLSVLYGIVLYFPTYSCIPAQIWAVEDAIISGRRGHSKRSISSTVKKKPKCSLNTKEVLLGNGTHSIIIFPADELPHWICIQHICPGKINENTCPGKPDWFMLGQSLRPNQLNSSGWSWLWTKHPESFHKDGLLKSINVFFSWVGTENSRTDEVKEQFQK